MISYEDLLKEFWKGHDPLSSGSRQYRSVILHSGGMQKEKALASKREIEKRIGRPVATDVEPLNRFWPAEEYHQKYYLQGRERIFEALRGLKTAGPWFESEAAARLNAYAAGHLDRDGMAGELERLALPEDLRSRLKALLPSKTLGRAGSGCR